MRMRLLGYALACACLLVVGVSAGAWAGVTHPLVGVFGAFASPGAVAVQQPSGDVLVLDRGANTVARFDAGGVPVVFAALGSNVLDGAGGGACPATPSDCDQTPQNGFAFDGSPGAAQVAIDQSGGPTDGEIYVTDSFHNVVDIFAADGRYLGQLSSSPHTGGFGETCGVAVDSTGTVYVAETSGWVHRYSPFSNPVTDADFSSEFYAGACNLAIDSSGDVFANQLFGAVNKYSPATDFEYTVDPGPAYGVAVDPATNQLYVVQGSQVAQFDVSSTIAPALLGSFGAGVVTTPAGVGVRGATNQLYVSDASANDVAVFGSGVPTPDASTGNASAVADTTATLNGTVNPNGTATTWQFQYGLDTSYGQTAPASPGDAGSGSSDVPVSTDLSGLQPGTTYHFRLVATGTNGTTYGADQTFTTQAPPTVDSESAAPVGKTTATVVAQVNPFGLDTSYHVEYSTDTGFSTHTPDSVIPAVFGDRPASTDLSGLQPNTTYNYHVVASNALGSVTGPDQQFTTQPVLNIDREYVTGLGSTAATLNADIDPLGDPTTYHFEYGTTTAYGTNVPATDADVGSGFGDVTVSQPLNGLTPDTLYHYRVVASNPVGTIQGPDHMFRTRALPATGTDSCPNAGIRSQEQASFLPDCRAYEMVSPPEKNGGDVSAAPARTRAAVDGNAVQFVSIAGFDDVHGTGTVGTDYVSQRTTTGWATHGITPPQSPPAFPTWASRYLGDFSDDLSTGVFYAISSVTNEDPNVAQLRNLYLRRDLLTPGPGHYQLISGCPACSSPLAATPFSLVIEDPAPAGASADFRHVIFESPVRLTADAPDNQPPGCAFSTAQCHPYLYESVDGHVRLAGVLPGAACVPSPPPCAAPMSAAGDGALDVDGFGTVQYTGSAISRDGSKIIFTAGPFTDPTSLGLGVAARLGDLYMRVDGSSTVQLNVSERSTPDPAGHQPALFGGASQDGTRVFFMTRELLTDDTQPGGGMNLYRYDLNAPAGHHLTVLTHDTQPADDSGFDRARYVVGTSADGSYVYFWGTNGLLPGQKSEGSTVKLLYVWHDGTLRFLGSDGGGGQRSPTNWGESGVLSGLIPDLTRVSPDGRHTTFVTPKIEMAQSVGFDNRNASCINGGGCAEVYLYDYGSDRVTCVSCDPGGGQPAGDAGFATNSPDLTKAAMPQHRTHAISDDGERVFFDTPDALVARDTNGKRDVYEYDAATGQVSLISTGRSSSDAFFVEATPSGSDVYFTTRQQLVGIDTDDATDLYDARVGGGIAAQSPPPTVDCTGEACLPAVSTSPSAPVLVGGVNFQAPRAGGPVRGRVRILRRVVRGSTLVVVVRVPAGGRVTVRGRLVGTVSRLVGRAGTYRLRVRLSGHARRVLRHRHLLVVRLRVSYRPSIGGSSSVVVVVVVVVRVKA